ncbi:hypothetical protein [Metamycoplasma hominis]|uniref:hypothetical protein n=1 Tax=Metamycoplasma hominis TaxID=2098 RepID=UPI003CEFE987
MEPLENTIWFAKMKNTQKFLLVSKLDSDLIKSNIFSTGFLGFCNSDNLPLSFLLVIIISEDFNVKKMQNLPAQQWKPLITKYLNHF